MSGPIMRGRPITAIWVHGDAVIPERPSDFTNLKRVGSGTELVFRQGEGEPPWAAPGPTTSAIPLRRVSQIGMSTATVNGSTAIATTCRRIKRSIHAAQQSPLELRALAAHSQLNASTAGLRASSGRIGSQVLCRPTNRFWQLVLHR